MNRGSATSMVGDLTFDCASMRPRFMNRGSARPARRTRPAGIGFNEAPIHESGKYALGVLGPNENHLLQ